jgi:hypothetical protein
MFTADEQEQIRGLVNAGISARTAIRAIEAIFPTATTEITRPAIANAMHPLVEVSEGASNALSFIAGAIAVRNDREKPAARLWPRRTFIERAFAELDDAITETRSAAEELVALAGVLAGAGDAASLPAVTLATTHLSRATTRLNRFDRYLAYADPLAWKADPLLQRDVQTNLYRASGQYLYDSLEGLVAAYSADPAVLTAPQLEIMRDALAWGWLIQDDMAKHVARLLGIPWVPGEAIIPIAFWDSIARTSPRFQFYLTYAGYLLQNEAAGARPKLQNFIATLVLPKGEDAWKRFDYFVGLLPTMAGWMAPGPPFGTLVGPGPVFLDLALDADDTDVLV